MPGNWHVRFFEGRGPATARAYSTGRSFLRTAERHEPTATSSPHLNTTATYSSDGLLRAKTTTATRRSVTDPRDAPLPNRTLHYLYFAGNPVARIETSSDPVEVLHFHADHLGAPILVTSTAGDVEWRGGFTPFGSEYVEEGVDVELRLPGQWVDAAWGTTYSYNLFRWHSSKTSRYSRTDPLGLREGPSLYAYARSNPIRFLDSLGLATFEGFEPAAEEVLREGVEEAREALKDSCAGCDSEALLKALDDAKFVATSGLLDRPLLPACAEVTFWGYLTGTIKVDPNALVDPGYSIECCSPAGLVVHEVTHLLFRGRIIGEGPAYANEYDCFGCQGSVRMQEFIDGRRPDPPTVVPPGNGIFPP